MYSQHSHVVENNQIAGNYNYIDDFRDDTVNEQIICDIYSGHNRQISIKLTA